MFLCFLKRTDIEMNNVRFLVVNYLIIFYILPKQSSLSHALQISIQGFVLATGIWCLVRLLVFLLF
jgi:hypothetical protein